MAKAKKKPAAKAKKPAPKKPAPKKPAPKKQAAPKKKAAPAKQKVEKPKKSRPRPEARSPKSVVVDVPSDAIPIEIAASDTSARRTLTARERLGRSSPVVEILEDEYPIAALRRFLDAVKGTATEQQAQIALGAAQLVLFPIAREHRGGAEVKELVDLVVSRWDDFGIRRSGFHAQEFLRNALAAVGVDRDRITVLEALVPETASAELRFNVACAHAVARDKVAMLYAIDTAIDAGASVESFRRDPDFAPYAADPDFLEVLARAEVPPIPVDIEPYIHAVRRALDSLIATLKEFGEQVELRPPARLDAILDSERARKISLPNDYRALLTLTNGMKVWGHEFFGANDYRENTKLALRAGRWLQDSASYGQNAVVGCTPIANWGQPNDWLLYDPRGNIRGGEPGYVLMLNADEAPMKDLAAALAWLENIARDVLGTN
jgi:hypothetical protein